MHPALRAWGRSRRLEDREPSSVRIATAPAIVDGSSGLTHPSASSFATACESRLREICMASARCLIRIGGPRLGEHDEDS